MYSLSYHAVTSPQASSLPGVATGEVAWKRGITEQSRQVLGNTNLKPVVHGAVCRISAYICNPNFVFKVSNTTFSRQGLFSSVSIHSLVENRVEPAFIISLFGSDPALVQSLVKVSGKPPGSRGLLALSPVEDWSLN